MLVTQKKRLALLISIVLVFVTISVVLAGGWIKLPHRLQSSGLWPHRSPVDPKPFSNEKPGVSESHIELFSASNKKGRYFEISFGGEEALNPSIIPHPVSKDVWIITAQKSKHTSENSVWFAEIVCNAKFNRKGILSCIDTPTNLPVAATDGGNCEGPFALMNLNIGPHDARAFYGPRHPYLIYGSNSGYTCFGQWIQDFRMLMDWEGPSMGDIDFKFGTELQRPAPFNALEKNFFVFWDKNGDMYVHHDMAPTRAFARLHSDGLVGPDLAPLALQNDNKCVAEYLPSIEPHLESIHQATNSLSITLCARSDPSCEPDDSNTFILTIIQHKTFYAFHSVYEPYPVLFHRTAPFHIFAISRKPLWYHGRAKQGEARNPNLKGSASGHAQPWNQTEMMYTTSIAWKTHGQKYHGYIDDQVFIGFGIEDKGTGGIDVPASALLSDYGLCSVL
ncbi:hypothetical protein B0A52_06419 [Exophiala mesophila]|uniref:Uncharacterized protein n=1 Tax=Exophiala mesophila TaxID=212818 RepID=A0A438N2A9_EXOME|nr:hypothetical protein B0A52_06419 [Exophiala mesophila]